MAKIMIVDDAAFMRMKASKLLVENGHEVIEATNGAEAIDSYKSQRPDAVLLDITMPDMDGLAALKALREVDPDARVAMVTAMGQQQIVMEAIKAGARDFVIKPFDATRIMAAVNKLLAA